MATTVERPAVRARAARSAPAGRGGRGESSTKLTLYVLAGVLGVVVFVVPLVWAVLRAFQPNNVITSRCRLVVPLPPVPRQFPGPGERGAHPPCGRQQPDRRHQHRRPDDDRRDGGRLRIRPLPVPRLGARPSALILLTLMIPFQAILTPLFLELNAMRLTNSRLGLVLFYTTVNLPFGVFVMRTTFAVGARRRWRRPLASTAREPCGPSRTCCARSSCPAWRRPRCTRSWPRGPSSSAR